jgi:YesN/AraC family two-component response regulator
LAGDGIAALKILENGHFDILITDINMPNMNGIELFNKVKKLFPQIPVIFVSGYDYKNLAKKLLREGALYFFKKPFDLNILKRAIKSILEMKYSESKINML